MREKGRQGLTQAGFLSQLSRPCGIKCVTPVSQHLVLEDEFLKMRNVSKSARKVESCGTSLDKRAAVAEAMLEARSRGVNPRSEI